MNFLHTSRRVAALLLAISLFGSQALAASLADGSQIAAASKSRGDVILFRGFGSVFSTGMDKIAAKLSKSRVKARVMSHNQWKNAARTIIANHKKFGPRPVILIGHSWGGNAILKLAKALNRERISVTYMVTFDATAPQPAPSNVRRLTNFYLKGGGWGVAVKRGSGFRGVLNNVDLSKDKKVSHTNIDDRPKLQDRIVRDILRHLRVSRRG